jgi:predicted TIM-barrel fold metal-dependent hydrolase
MALTLEQIKGRVGDLDAHEQIPIPHYPEVFGEVGERFVKENTELWEAAKRITQYKPDEDAFFDAPDDAEINQENVWTLKGGRAPGVIDMDRRLAAMDEMGIHRQLVFPMMGIYAWIMALGGNMNWFPKASPEQQKLGVLAVDAYNKWAGGRTKVSDRTRMVGILLSNAADMTPELLVKKTEELLDSGIRAITLSSGMPPAGVSPGNPVLDPFYDLLAKANVPLVFHPPSGIRFRASDIWEANLVNMGYARVQNLHVAERNFIGSMLLSGVFERHETLRLGCIEAGVEWIGPFAEELDFVFDQPSRGSNPRTLAMRPSETLNRNVRVAALCSEPVEKWIDRYPQVMDCYCYSSDYPHVEGGRWSMQRFHDRLAPMGEEIVEKFFVSNPQWLLAD